MISNRKADAREDTPPDHLLFQHSLHPEERAYVLGDCEEEYRAIAAAHGRRRANRWFRAQVARSLAFNVLRRARRHTSAPRLQRDGLLMATWSDVKLALRQLRHSPEFSIPALLTLAVGIGVAAAIFTVVQRVVLSPLPYPEADRLVRLFDRNETVGLPRFSVSPGTTSLGSSRIRRSRRSAHIGRMPSP